MEYSIIVVTTCCLTGFLIGMVDSTNEFKYTTHKNISVGRATNTSMCGVFALTEDDQSFHILSDGYYIDPPCSIYLTGVNRINNIYRLSGMCFKMSDVLLPCGRNDTIIIRGWALQIFNQTQSVSLYTNQSMLVTEKILKCDNKQDFTMNYDFCWENIPMLQILLYSRNKPSTELPTITVHTRALIERKFPPLSLHDMNAMSIQMSQCSCDDPNCRICKPTAHDMYIDLLKTVIKTIGDNDNNDENDNKSNQEDVSSSSVDLNMLLPSLIGAIATVAVAVVGGIKCNKEINKRNKNKPPEEQWKLRRIVDMMRNKRGGQKSNPERYNSRVDNSPTTQIKGKLKLNQLEVICLISSFFSNVS